MKYDSKDITKVAIFAALISIGAFIKIPFFPVPITLQTMFVILAGLVLNKKLAVTSIIVYIIIGLLGVPVFSSGGGIFYVVNPTFGYLLSFIFAAYVIAAYKDKMNDYLLAILGTLIILILGMLYFVAMQYFVYTKSFEIGFIFSKLFLVFLPGGIFKSVVAVIVAQRLNKANKYI